MTPPKCSEKSVKFQGKAVKLKWKLKERQCRTPRLSSASSRATPQPVAVCLHDSYETADSVSRGNGIHDQGRSGGAAQIGGDSHLPGSSPPSAASPTRAGSPPRLPRPLQPPAAAPPSPPPVWPGHRTHQPPAVTTCPPMDRSSGGTVARSGGLAYSALRVQCKCNQVQQ